MLRDRVALAMVVVALGCGDDGTALGNGSGSSSSTGAPATDGAEQADDADTAAADDAPDTAPDDAPDDAPIDSSEGSPEDTAGGSSESSGDDTGGNGTQPFQGLCYGSPPDGAELPPPLPEYTGGECPPLVPGFNPIVSAGNDRSVLVVAPSDLQDDEVLPVAVLWYWLGGSANSFLEKGDVQNAVDEYRFIALIPEEKGDLLFRWPFSAIDSDARAQEELVFLDDMLACAAANYNIEPNCVTSVGVSAGALWTSQVASGRGEYLASAVSLSGGTGGLTKPWGGSPHKMPVFVLWGGPMDFCIAIDFQMTSQDFEMGLENDGHAIIECIHNCSHSVPPFDVPERQTDFAPMWEFFLDHPYWLEDGETTWADGFPEYAPMWCGVGAGSATMREGECGPSAC